MSAIRFVWSTLWRSVVVGLGYFLALMLVALAGGRLGLSAQSSPSQAARLPWLLAATLLFGLVLGPLAARLPAARGQQALLWSSLIFFNLGAVAIEGALFAPALVAVPLPLLAAEQLAGALAAGGLIALLFGPRGQAAAWAGALRTRAGGAWAWRFAASALSYVLFYWLFGALNYALVTGPYYAAHAGGLTVPAPAVVLAAELVRGPLLVLSIWLFVLSLPAWAGSQAAARRWPAMLLTGLLLFWVGGVVPLVMQAGALPWLLLGASAVEIFCQNVLTGVVAAWLLLPAQPAGQPIASTPSAAQRAPTRARP